jgi:hypothetical protein
MSGLKRVIIENPARITGLAQVMIACGIAFGLGWTGEQVGAVMAVTGGIVMFLGDIFMTPNATFNTAVNAEAENIAAAVAADQAALTPAELARIDRQIEKLQADFDKEMMRQ